jgi:hypothetical protein
MQEDKERKEPKLNNQIKVNVKRFGFFAALVAAFAAGTKAGVKYAKDHYVSKDRKFIEAEILKREKQK